MIKYSADLNSSDVVKLTQELIRIPSHKYTENREAAAAEFIYKYCSEHGLEAEYQEVEGPRRNVLVRLRGKGTGKTLLFNGHIDTVPPYEMTVEPYGGLIEDSFVTGRGANDMKGAVACMITAMLQIKNKGIVLGGDIVLAAVAGEEEKSDGTETVVKSGIRADGAVVGEPSNYGYALGHRGLEWLEIKIQGKAAHGGIPEMGINAISKAAKLINRIESRLMPNLKTRQNEWMGPSVMNFGLISGGTQPSSVADSCVIQIDRRYLPEENVDSVIREYQDIIDELKNEDPDFQASISRMESNLMVGFDHAPLIAQPLSEIAQTVTSVLRQYIGKEPTIEKRRGWTDAGVLSTYGKIPTVVTGPGDLKYSHTRDEKIPVADLVNYVEIYKRIAEEFCR